jgi:hypothetical protein
MNFGNASDRSTMRMSRWAWQSLWLMSSSDSSACTAEITEAILRMYERNSKADGFDTFGTFNRVIE